MNISRKAAATVAAIAGLATLGTTVATAQVPLPPTAVGGAHTGMKRERHPDLVRALRSLQRTEASLRHANRDFGGHREKAADLCHQAEQEVILAIQSDKG